MQTQPTTVSIHLFKLLIDHAGVEVIYSRVASIGHQAKLLGERTRAVKWFTL
jgi:hypothetical protein